jgi:hypothetical protein
VSFDVHLDYVSDAPNDTLPFPAGTPLVGLPHDQPYVVSFLRLDVRQSSAALAPGGDFSAFSFLPSGLLTGWSDTSDPAGGIFRFDTLIDATGIAQGTSASLGTLTYNLNPFQIAPSPALFVSIVGNPDPTAVNGPTILGTEDPKGLSDPFGYIPQSLLDQMNQTALADFRFNNGDDPAWRDTFGYVDPSFYAFTPGVTQIPGVQPLVNPAAAVPEPASLSLAASAGLCLAFYARRRKPLGRAGDTASRGAWGGPVGVVG